MKLVTFDAGRVGRIDGDVVVELDCGSMREYFERGGAVGETGQRPRLADVRLRAPIVPKKFFHTAGNFTEHHEELQKVNWSHPVHKGIVFFQNVDAIIGPDDPVIYPEHLTKELDYELELAIIIGKSGKFFGPDEAAGYIAGYTVFNDITARDIQRREMKSGVFSFSKAIDTFCPIGPWIVTADEIPDPHSLAMELRVNGDIRQKGIGGNGCGRSATSWLGGRARLGVADQFRGPVQVAQVTRFEQVTAAAQAGRRAFQDEPAMRHHVAAIGDLQGQRDVLLDQQHRGVQLVGHPAEYREQTLHHHRARPRLISSISRARGRRTMARPTASICCSPPDGSPALRSRHLRSSGSRSRTSSWPASRPADRRRFSPAVRLANSARPSGTSDGPPRASRCADLPAMSLPSIRIVPASGRCSPAMVASVVVFPAPLGPISPTISPSFTVRLTLSTAVTPP